MLSTLLCCLGTPLSLCPLLLLQLVLLCPLLQILVSTPRIDTLSVDTLQRRAADHLLPLSV